MKRKIISACGYHSSSLSRYIDVRESLYWVCLLMGVRMWASRNLHFFCIRCIMYFKSETNDLILGALDHCPFHHCIHYWCDFTSCLIWVDHHFSSYIHCFTIILVIACDSSHSLHPLVLFLRWPIPNLIFPFHHSCISHYQVDLPHCLFIDVIFTLGTLRFMAHRLFYTCCILYMKAWVFDHWVFGSSFPSFLLPYHLSLSYVPCLKTTLRPWN